MEEKKKAFGREEEKFFTIVDIETVNPKLTKGKAEKRWTSEKIPKRS